MRHCALRLICNKYTMTYIFLQNRVILEETKLKQSVGLRKFYESPEARKKISDAMKNLYAAYRLKRGWKARDIS